MRRRLIRFFLLVVVMVVFVPRLTAQQPQTSADPYLFDLPTSPDYDIIPLVTVEDEMPLLEGSYPNMTASVSQQFAFTGIPDGLAFVESADAYYVWSNHEIASAKTPFNSSTTDGVRGARVSLLKFSKNWELIGGRNLIDTVIDNGNGVTYELNPASGYYENPSDSADLLSGTGLMSRFCTSFGATTGFIDKNGTEVPLYFAPEEGGSLRGWAVYPDGEAYSLEGLGRFSKEQIVSATQYRATNSDTTVLLGMEDSGNGEVYMFVGQQTVADPNGLNAGELYVLRVEDVLGNYQADELSVQDVTYTATWTLVPNAIVEGSAGDLSNFVDADDNSTNFRRPEDIHEDPNNLGTFYMAMTGGTQMNGDNPYGKLYRLTLNPEDPTADGTIAMVYEGGPNLGVSFDNLTVDSHGRVLIQEDSTAEGQAVLNDEQRDDRVLAYDIATDSAEFWFEANTNNIAPLASRGAWETTGILEVNSHIDQGLDHSSLLINVQAHSLPSVNYSQFGQLLLAQPSQFVPTAVGYSGGTSLSISTTIAFVLAVVAALALPTIFLRRS